MKAGSAFQVPTHGGSLLQTTSCRVRADPTRCQDIALLGDDPGSGILRADRGDGHGQRLAKGGKAAPRGHVRGRMSRPEGQVCRFVEGGGVHGCAWVRSGGGVCSPCGGDDRDCSAGLPERPCMPAACRTFGRAGQRLRRLGARTGEADLDGLAGYGVQDQHGDTSRRACRENPAVGQRIRDEPRN